MEIYAGYFGIRKKDRRTDEIIGALGLSDKALSRPRSLSGGMKRRLLIAKALVHSPEILVLDEPTAGVDVELRNQLWEYVKDLNEKGTTIVLTTHYLEEAEKLCDEIAVIDKGSIIACDKKDNLMSLLSQKELVIVYGNKNKPILNNMPLNTSVNWPKDGNISISYDPKKVEIEVIIKELIKNNVEILDILTKQPDLEEIFRFLIKKNLN